MLYYIIIYVIIAYCFYEDYIYIYIYIYHIYISYIYHIFVFITNLVGYSTKFTLSYLLFNSSEK